jgi:hypothetical protein
VGRLCPTATLKGGVVKDEHGWSISVWSDRQGIKISCGPLSNSINLELLIFSDKARSLESLYGHKIEDLFCAREDYDGETINVMWWTLFDKNDLRVFVKRLQTMLETEDEIETDTL